MSRQVNLKGKSLQCAMLMRWISTNFRAVPPGLPGTLREVARILPLPAGGWPSG
jgi:hypothetical protein